MRKIVRTLLSLVGLLVVMVFAIGNRGSVEVSYWPLPFAQVVPLWYVVLAALIIGVALGAGAMWLSGHRHRVALRRLRDEVSGYRYEAEQRRLAEERAAAEARRNRSLALSAPKAA